MTTSFIIGILLGLYHITDVKLAFQVIIELYMADITSDTDFCVICGAYFNLKGLHIT